MDQITLEAKEKLSKSIEALRNELVTIRTGRATPAMLDRVECEYYGDKILINQISLITVPEPRQLVVKPYDKADIKAIVAGINAANIGLNPVPENDIIRITIPPLTEDSRRELAKKAKAIAEESKIAIRNIRRDFIDFIKSADDMTEDLQKRVQEEVEKVVSEAVSEVDSIYAQKEKDIMSL